jgi:hypothetical protein
VEKAAGDVRRLRSKGRTDVADAIERNAETQNRYRDVNERVAEIYRQFAAGPDGDTATALIELFCECGQQAPCGERVSITPAMYEQVRSDPTTFVLFPGHEIATVEAMIEQGDGFLIARNFGRAAEIARAADPRRLVRITPSRQRPGRLVL